MATLRSLGYRPRPWSGAQTATMRACLICMDDHDEGKRLLAIQDEINFLYELVLACLPL